MDKTIRGDKHICSNCGTKFFDFKKEKIICPKCNTDLTAKKAKSSIDYKSTIVDEQKSTDPEASLEEEVVFDEEIEDIIDEEIDVEEEKL